MSIRPSSAKEIDSLVADLGDGRAVTREAAVARLTIIGARAVERLMAVAGANAPAAVRTGALRALDAIGDPRGRSAVFEALVDADAVVAAAAVLSARRYLEGPHGPETLDRLTQIALDRHRSGAVRAAAVRAVCTLDEATIAPLLDALRGDDDRHVRDAANHGRSAPKAHDPAAMLEAAAGGELPADPAALRDAIVHAGGTAALQALLRVVEAVRAREALEPADARAGWTAARAAAHVALAMRGSRIALYDLRESLESANASLPVEWIAALSAVGDATCLEAIAAAHARTRDGWWREHLARTFREIIKREGLTRRHAVLKKVAARWPEVLSATGPEP